MPHHLVVVSLLSASIGRAKVCVIRACSDILARSVTGYDPSDCRVSSCCAPSERQILCMDAIRIVWWVFATDHDRRRLGRSREIMMDTARYLLNGKQAIFCKRCQWPVSLFREETTTARTITSPLIITPSITATTTRSFGSFPEDRKPTRHVKADLSVWVNDNRSRYIWCVMVHVYATDEERMLWNGRYMVRFMCIWRGKDSNAERRTQ